MTPRPARTGELASVVEAVRAAAADLVRDGRGGPAEVEVVRHVRRARCSLARIDLVSGPERHALFVKLRHAGTTTRTGDREGRPRVADATELSPLEAARLEHSALTRLAAAVAQAADPRLAAVEPVLLVPEAAAIVLRVVEAPTLRDLLRRTARVPPSRGRPDAQPWRSAGALLRLYHSLPPPDRPLPRLLGRDELGVLLTDLLTYLAGRGAARELLRGVEGRVGELLPDTPRRADPCLGHTDFAPRNVFVQPGGPVSLFDPMPRWVVPAGDDLATFVVESRVNGLQLVSRGLAHGRADLARREAALLAGYGMSPDDPHLRLLILLALLDRWAGLASPPATEGARGTLERVRLAWLRGALVREVRRELSAPPVAGR